MKNRFVTLCIFLMLTAGLCSCTQIDSDVAKSSQAHTSTPTSNSTISFPTPSAEQFDIKAPYSTLFDCAVQSNESRWTLSIPRITVLDTKTDNSSSMYFCKIHYYEYEIEDDKIVDRGEKICRAIITIKENTATFNLVPEEKTAEILKKYGFVKLANYIEHGQTIMPIWKMSAGDVLLAQYCSATSIVLSEK